MLFYFSLSQAEWNFTSTVLLFSVFLHTWQIQIWEPFYNRYILLLVFLLVKDICVPRAPLLLFRHGWILQNKYSEICITLKLMNSPQWYLWPFVFIFRKHVSVFLAKMLAENKKSHEYSYKGSRLGMFIRTFSNLWFPFFSHLFTNHKY